MKKARIRQAVCAVLREELASMLHDVSYRLSVLDNAQNGGKIGSRGLNLLGVIRNDH